MHTTERRLLADLLLAKAVRTGMLKIELRSDPNTGGERLVLMARACPGFPFFTITTLPLNTPKGPAANAISIA